MIRTVPRPAGIYVGVQTVAGESFLSVLGWSKK